MSVTAGLNSSYSLVPGTSDVDRRAATLYGSGATAVVATLGLQSDTVRTDTVNLGADLSNTTASTPTAGLTSSLAQLLQGASHVDQATGAREINQGISDKLAGQIGQLLAASGFAQADAAKASASLVQQFASASAGTNVLALSLSSQSQSAGAYTALVAGGKEVSAYSVQSTARLNIAFDARSGDLLVKLDEHKVAATRIEWSSETATDVSIDLSQPELEAIGFTPIGTNRNATGSAVQESVTTTAEGDPHSEIGSGNIPGPKSLEWYLNFEREIDGSLPPETGVVRPIAGTATTAAISSAGGGSAKQASAEAAVVALKKIVAEARSAFASQDPSSSRSVGLTVTQQIGASVSGQTGRASLLYSRPSGAVGVIAVTGLSAIA